MNRILLKYNIFILLTLILTVQSSPAQETELDYFEANQNQEQVLLKWAISRGSVCNGITITRSSDSLYFQTIGRIEGVCGSPDFQQPYSFVDETPLKNKKAFYRLELGVTDFSDIISFTLIDKNEKGYQIIPNPIQNQGRIYFNNPFREEFILSLFSINGSLLLQGSSREEYFQINSSELKNGIYFFTITYKEEAIRGKFLVIH